MLLLDFKTPPPPSALFPNFKLLFSSVEVTFASGDSLQVDHILVAVGLEPSTELGDSAGLEVHKDMGESLFGITPFSICLT